MSKYAVNNDKREHYKKLAGSRQDKVEIEKEDVVNSCEISPVVIINKECPICLDEIYSNEEYIIFDTCFHSYHLKCINQWKCQCNSISSLYKCELCQQYRDIREFNQNEAEPIEVEKPRRISWIKKCIRKIFG